MQGNWTKYFRREFAPVIYRHVRKWSASAHYLGAKQYTFYQLEYHLEREHGIMARKKSASAGHTATKVSGAKGNTVWLNYKFTPEDIVVVREDVQDTVALCARLAGLFAEGIDLTVRYVPERKNYSAFAVGAAPGDSPDRIGISAFGGTVWEALAALLFKIDLFRQSPDALTAGSGSVGIG